MHKLILATLICLSGISAQQEIKAAQRAPISNDTLIAAGISAAGAGLLYLAYKINYKNTLADAHDALADGNKKLQEIALQSEKYFQIAQPHIWLPADIHRAYSLAAEIKGAIAQLQEMRITIERHQCEWKGYKDFDYTNAEMFIFSAKNMASGLQETLTVLQQTIIAPLEAAILAEKNRQALVEAYQRNATQLGSFLGKSGNTLEEDISFAYRSNDYPLLAGTNALEYAAHELAQKANVVEHGFAAKQPSLDLAQEIKVLIKYLINSAEYKAQKEHKRITDAEKAELAEKRRIAQAHIDAQERAARAAEATAYAEQQRANAEHIRAQAEAEKARVERERWNKEWWNDVLGVKKEKPEVNVTIHNN